MKLIGLTGGIGTGKSTVARILRLRGYEVYDCDLEAKRLMDESPEVRRSLRDRWGEEIYSARGELDRRKVAEYVFADRREKAWLDSLVHGLVRDDVKDGQPPVPITVMTRSLWNRPYFSLPDSPGCVRRYGK